MAGETQSWDQVWAELVSQGWRIECGSRGKGTQNYYLPPGVNRGAPFKNRVDYFDSKKWVLRSLPGRVDADVDATKTDAITQGEVNADLDATKADAITQGEVHADLDATKADAITQGGVHADLDSPNAAAMTQDKVHVDLEPTNIAAITQDKVHVDLEPTNDAAIDVTDAGEPTHGTDVTIFWDIRHKTVRSAAHQPRGERGPVQGTDLASKNDKPPSVQHQEVQRDELPSSDAGWAEGILLLKSSIHPSTPEIDVLSALKRLEVLGSCPLEILRVTAVGKTMTKLMKHTRHSTVRRSARALLTSWKGSVYAGFAGGSPVPDDADKGECAPIISVGPSANDPQILRERSVNVDQPIQPRQEAKSKPKLPPILAELRALDIAEVAPRTPKRRRMHPEQLDQCDKENSSRDLNSNIAKKHCPRRPKGVMHSTTDSSATPTDDGHPIARHVEKRDASSDFVFELDSGERVLLQCDLEGCLASLRNICSTDGCRVASDDQALEAESFWEEFCSIASSV